MGKESNYFNEKTEESIVAFQQATDIKTKQFIFETRIKKSFEKLIENVIFVYKFQSLDHIDILKNDCLSFLFEQLSKFDHTRGHKAFSYFNVITKNWFIQKVKDRKKKDKNKISLDKDLLRTLEKTNDAMCVKSFEEEFLEQEFMELLKEDIRSWRDKFHKDQEQKVLDAVITLMDNADSIQIYNKKAVFLYIREITGLNTKQIVSNLNKIKKKYYLFIKKYREGNV